MELPTVHKRVAPLAAPLVLAFALFLAACGGAPQPTATTAPPTTQPTAVPTEASQLPTAAPTNAPTLVPPTATSAPPAASPTSAPTVTPTAAAELTQPPAASSVTLPPPDCSAGLTPAQTEGPYYTPGSPERGSLLEPGMEGTRLIVTGYVLNRDCKPIPGAWLDFWQADDSGEYDNVGYRLRGHQFTDENGIYRLETILPANYGGRPRHIHVKIQAPNQRVLTSQLYFPGVAENETDSIFNPRLVVTMEETTEGLTALFNFVLDVP